MIRLPLLAVRRTAAAAARFRGFPAASFSTHAYHPDPYSNKHKSISEALVNAQPVVLCHSTTAVCDGGGGAMGHPIEFITLESKNPWEPQDCKYCGTKYLGDKYKDQYLEKLAEKKGAAAAAAVQFVDSPFQPPHRH
jgi:NADH dehydrogenase (ubiquinone) Fe-S protein 6